MKTVAAAILLLSLAAFGQSSCPDLIRHIRVGGVPADNPKHFNGYFRFSIKNVWDKQLNKVVLTFSSYDSATKQPQAENLNIEVKFKPGQEKSFEWTSKSQYPQGSEAHTTVRVVSANFADGTTWNASDHPECDLRETSSDKTVNRESVR